ncbi:hypothetical protein ALC57_16406 [Trachymyrmex cornetzi]|uniref:Uncharacterized protein n=1 Tax=Trachymyrmex cornetzi TaxID=471704 RepID=A0A151IV95_9HYME|nr:hypothetical protein ALC57_16406 [Trachymyrmex cornetzi]
MSFLHTHSSECIKSELDFFSLPPTQTSIESSQWIYYKPVTSLYLHDTFASYYTTRYIYTREQEKSQKHDIFRNIEAWRKNILTEKANQSENAQATAEEKKDLPKFDSTTDRDKANTSVSQTSSIFENSTTHVLAKEVNSIFTHTFPLSCLPTPKNEFAGSFKRLTSSQCPICRGLSCRPTAEGVDEVDCHCR